MQTPEQLIVFFACTFSALHVAVKTLTPRKDKLITKEIFSAEGRKQTLSENLEDSAIKKLDKLRKDLLIRKIRTPNDQTIEKLIRKEKKEDMKHRLFQAEIVMCSHYIPCLVMIVYCLYTNGVNYTRPNMYLEILIFTNLIGYLIHDTAFSLYYSYLTPIMAIHHFAAFLNLLVCIYIFPFGGSVFVAALFWSMITDPLYTTRLMVERYGVDKKSDKYNLLLWVQFLLYFTKSFYGIPSLTWMALTHKEVPFIQGCLTLLL